MAKLTRVSTPLVRWTNTIAGFVSRLVGQKLEDSLNVKDFGAMGNYHTVDETGANDTAAFAAAINYFKTLGTRRTAGKLCIRVPAGVYKVDRIVLDAAISFGIEFVGDGWLSTSIRFDHTIDEPAIQSAIEMVRFNDIMIAGTLKDTNTTADKWRKCGYEGKLASKRADIDVMFQHCGFYGFVDGIQAHGRGVVVENCVVGFTTNLINIVTSNDILWDANSLVNGFNTGARHYTVRGCRYDQGNSVLTVSGAGTWRDYIHDVLIVDNDLYSINCVIEAPDATLRRCIVANNTGLRIGLNGLFKLKSMHSSQLVNNNFTRNHDDYNALSTTGDTMRLFLHLTGNGSHITITGNTMKCLRYNFVQIDGSCSSIIISNNSVVQAWAVAPEQSGKFVFYSPSDCPNLVITDNVFSASATAGTYHLFNTAQVSRLTRVAGNLAPWAWTTNGLKYAPVLSGAGTGIGSARWRYEEGMCYVDFMVSMTSATSNTGNVTITLPPGVQAQALDANLTSGYAGGGAINRIVGFTPLPNNNGVDFRLVVNPTTNLIEVWEGTNPTPQQLTYARRTASTVQIFGSVAFKCVG